MTSPGLSDGALYTDQDGNLVEQEATVVLVCCGAIESARLLLASKSNLFPDGLANGSGQLGRNATFHEYFFNWLVRQGDPGPDLRLGGQLRQRNVVALGNWRVNKNKEVMEAAGASTVIPVYFAQPTGNACHQHGQPGWATIG